MKESYDHRLCLNGLSAFVFDVTNSGRNITVAGWHLNRRKFKPGQRVLLVQESGEETRYKIKDVRCPSDPPDQYFMDCEFDPRKK